MLPKHPARFLHKAGVRLPFRRHITKFSIHTFCATAIEPCLVTAKQKNQKASCVIPFVTMEIKPSKPVSWGGGGAWPASDIEQCSVAVGKHRILHHE